MVRFVGSKRTLNNSEKLYRLCLDLPKISQRICPTLPLSHQSSVLITLALQLPIPESSGSRSTTDTRTLTHMHARTHARTHSNTLIHMHVHTHTHKHSHTHTHTPVPMSQALLSGCTCPLSCVHPHQHLEHLHSLVKHCRASADSTTPAFWLTFSLIYTQLHWSPGTSGSPVPSFLSLSGPQIQEPLLQLCSTVPRIASILPQKDGSEMARRTDLTHTGNRAGDKRQVTGSSPPSQYSRL